MQYNYKKLFVFSFLSIISAIYTEDKASADLPASRFSEIYSEAGYFSEVDNFAGLLTAKTGLDFNQIPNNHHLLPYLLTRVGADVRTILESTNGVFNDNFVFTGVGLDYLCPYVPGFRFTAQGGYSFDITKKYDRAGFDARLGFTSYHEFNSEKSGLFSEIYSEGFYIRRYKDKFGSLQLRGGHRSLTIETGRKYFEFSPLGTVNFSIDTQKIDYNRFVELGFGPRMTVKLLPNFSASLRPYYTWGWRWQHPTNEPYYEDFRLLFTAFYSF